MRPSTLFAVIGCALVLGAPSNLHARSLYGTATKVQSADLLTVKHDTGTYEVRVYGIDVPDSTAIAEQAETFTSELLTGERFRVRIMSRNKRGEMESQIVVNGQDLALELLRAGLATRESNVHYKPERDGEPDALVAAEDSARLAQCGIWAQPDRSASADSPTATESPLPAAIQVAGTLDTNASKKSGDDNECAMAIDPTNPMRLFQSCNTSSTGLFAAFSNNGGQTWGYPDPSDKTIADGDAGQGQSACCDPTLAWDRFGNLYVTYINANLNAIVTLLSTDSGSTFTELASFSGSVDQPTVAVSSVGRTAHVWVVWNGSGSMVARGAEASALGVVGTFSAAQTVSGSSGCNFGDLAISPAGVLVQICQQPSSGQNQGNLRFNVDADGLGAGGWSATTTATTTNVGGFDFLPAQNARSVDAEAGLAYDANPGSARFGRLYLVYTEETVNESNDMDILLRFSDNNGTSWSAPVKVNDDSTTRSQFLPKLAVDLDSGTIGVCWHDARNSGNNTAVQLYCATSEPLATPVFTGNVQVSDGASLSNGQGVEFGDYMGMAFVGGVLKPVWGDTSNSTADNPGGTSAFDAYSDTVPVASASLFRNGFE